MDSLLLVLVVVGVIMILAGLARMRSKRRYGWDDIDHSVLFSKNEHDLDEKSISGTSSAVDNEPQLDRELERLSGLIVDEVDSAPSTTNAFDEQLSTETESSTKSENRARSILGKLRKAKPDRKEAAVEVKRYKEGAPNLVVVLNVMAPKGQQFLGSALIEAINNVGFSFGEMDIFHFQKNNESLFSLVNMVKPGSFDMSAVESMMTPGVSIFIQMPNQAHKGTDIFEHMLSTTSRLTEIMGAELKDEHRCVLTNSAIDHIRQQIAEYDCKWLNATAETA
jgi:cell division protein ZipA